jgi:predicted PurR-regulated permease PerM
VTTNQANEASPTPEPTPRAAKLRRHLPRAGLILFLLAMIVVFHSVLLPFVLAVFFAYLIYPVVSLLERIPFGRRHAPRWLAVITVYAVLFTIGWNTIPPLAGSLLVQLRKLAYDAPCLFHQGKSYRNKLDVWVKERLEVTELNQDARTDLFDDVEALQKGKLVATPTPDGQQILPPPSPPKPPSNADAGDERARPVVINNYSLIHIEIPGSKVRTKAAGASGEHGAKSPSEPPGGNPESEEPASSGGEGEQSQEPQQPRFGREAADLFKTALRDAINAELKRPGLATGLPLRVESEIVPELARRHLGLPADDPQLLIFAHNAGISVASAISQEDYAGLLDRYIEAGAKQAQLWIQEQLKGLYDFVYRLAGGIFDFFMVLMLTAFFLVFFPRVRDYLRDLVSPQFRDDYAKVLKRIDRRLSGAIRGQVIICLINAALTFPGLWFIGTQLTKASSLASYSVLLSVVAGVLSLIPIFGVILSTVPMVVLALTQHSLGGALLVIGWISIIHSIEAYILNPNILGHSASMNPIIVVFALLAGREVGGLIGALLAVPIASVVVSLFGYYRRLVAEGALAEQGGEAVEDVWDD